MQRAYGRDDLTDEVTDEEPIASAGSPSRRRMVRALVGVVVVALVGLALASLDREQQLREVGHLLDAAVSAEKSATTFDRYLAARRSEAFQLTISRERVDQIDVAVTSTAGAESLTAQRARRAVSRTRVLPWHAAVRQARTDLVAYLDAREAYVQAVVSAFVADRTLGRDSPDLLRAQARRSMLAALAAGGGGSSGDRIIATLSDE